MDTFEQQKSNKWVFVLIGLAILAIGGFLIFKQRMQNQVVEERKETSANNAETKEQLKVNRADLESSRLPDRIPSNIPLEANAKITQNYNANTDDGRFQGVRVFETSKSLDENAKIYSDYLKANGWKETVNFQQSRLRVISGSKDNVFLTITISENSITNIRTVEITTLEVKSGK